MATITVTCPTCDSELELDAAYRGQEVECGSCHQVFVAKPARGERTDRDDRPSRRDRDDRDRDDRRPVRRSSRRSRRYEDDEDDYDDDYYDRRRRESEGTGLGDAALIIGVIGFFVFWCPIIGGPLSIVGVILGGLGLRSPRNGTAIAGLVLNIVDLLFCLFFMLFWNNRW